MSHVYSGPGKYIAVCNNSNFDGHYVKEFEIPDTAANKEVSASWFFLNIVDFIACLEAVYPVEIFEEVRRG